jgi:DNA-binding MarR family transcriptional regulator
MEVSEEQAQIWAVQMFAEALGIEPYALSRLLTKLELHRHVTRERSGTGRIVAPNIG